MITASLIPHPTTPCPFIERVEVSIAIHQNSSFRRKPESIDQVSPWIPAFAGMTLLYKVTGDINRLRIPAPSLPREVTGLWKHTCCEAFIKPDGQSSYHEANFAPSGEWAVFALRDYREMVPYSHPTPPHIHVTRSASELILEAQLALPVSAPFALALSTVLENDTGTLSYWALAHPDAKPNFHHPHSFTLKVPA